MILLKFEMNGLNKREELMDIFVNIHRIYLTKYMHTKLKSRYYNRKLNKFRIYLVDIVQCKATFTPE